jgi:hypothetical protein
MRRKLLLYKVEFQNSGRLSALHCDVYPRNDELYLFVV